MADWQPSWLMSDSTLFYILYAILIGATPFYWSCSHRTTGHHGAQSEVFYSPLLTKVGYALYGRQHQEALPKAVVI